MLKLKRVDLPEAVTTARKGLSKEEYERLFIDHKKVFLSIIYDFVIGNYGWINENDMLDICNEILSRVCEGGLKKRNEFNKEKGKFYTWMRPRIISRCLDYFKKSYISHEIGDHKEEGVCGADENEDTSDKKDSYLSDREQYIDWENSGRGDVGDTIDHPVDKSLEYKRKRRDEYLKDKLETLISIKDIREHKKKNPEYTLPEALELLPYLSDCKLDILIAAAKREPRDKTAKELDMPKKTLDKIISRMAKKRV